MALNRACDVPAADWLSQTHVKNYRNFSRAVIQFVSVVEIPIKHSSLYNKYVLNKRKHTRQELCHGKQSSKFSYFNFSRTWTKRE